MSTTDDRLIGVMGELYNAVPKSVFACLALRSCAGCREGNSGEVVKSLVDAWIDLYVEGLVDQDPTQNKQVIRYQKRGWL